MCSVGIDGPGRLPGLRKPLLILNLRVAEASFVHSASQIIPDMACDLQNPSALALAGISSLLYTVENRVQFNGLCADINPASTASICYS